MLYCTTALCVLSQISTRSVHAVLFLFLRLTPFLDPRSLPLLLTQSPGQVAWPRPDPVAYSPDELADHAERLTAAEVIITFALGEVHVWAHPLDERYDVARRTPG